MAGKGSGRIAVKRAVDILVSVTFFVLFGWLVLLVAFLVRLKLGSPVLFVQDRPGLGGKVFRIYKFRTMRNAAGSDGRPLSDEERMTRFGALLRKTSLDELPEFWNVLMGDMSLVGPRPLLTQYLERYSPEQARRHEVRPGLTGWAQVNGRNAVDWDERLAMDVWYVDHQSLSLDLKIVWMTVAVVFGRSGVSADGHVTMPEFMGSQEENKC